VTVNSAQSFLFFTDACDGCMVASANAVLPILNAVGSWSATLGSSDNTYPYTGTLNGSGSYVTAFASLPTIAAGAYSPLVGVPSANVIYDGDATIDGPFSVVAPASNGSSCVFLTTDTTQFWKTGGIITAAQADALALAYLDAAIGVGVPCESVAVTPATWSATKQLYRDSAR
jgi:hypothetical protein